jgi:cation transporter-like permease
MLNPSSSMARLNRASVAVSVLSVAAPTWLMIQTQWNVHLATVARDGHGCGMPILGAMMAGFAFSLLMSMLAAGLAYWAHRHRPDKGNTLVWPKLLILGLGPLWFLVLATAAGWLMQRYVAS